MARAHGRGAVAARAALGNTTKSPTPPQAGKAKNARAYRFALQSVARDLLPENRVAWCLRRVRPGRKSVDILKSKTSGQAFYQNLVTCGLLWDCPVCAARIANTRRDDLAEGFTNALALDLELVFGTFTLRHSSRDVCEKVLGSLLGAYKRMKSGKAWSTFAGQVGLVGDIRALEPTHGEHGWHAHIHAVFFVSDKSVSVERVESFLRKRWLRMLAKQGASAIGKYGVVVKVGDEAIADYLNKFGTGWSLEDELARSTSKTSRSKKGLTPFGMLAKYLENMGAEGEDADAKRKENKKLKRLFREYSAAFKGKRHLQFSRGLREKLQMGREMEDLEIVESEADDAALLASLSLSDWRVVLSANKRAEVLDVATSAGSAGVRAFVDALRRDDNGVQSEAMPARRSAARKAAPTEQSSAEPAAPILIERAGVCMTCGQTTTDWWFYDGGTGRCKCRACGVAGASAAPKPLMDDEAIAVRPAAPARSLGDVVCSASFVAIQQVFTTGPPAGPPI